MEESTILCSKIPDGKLFVNLRKKNLKCKKNNSCTFVYILCYQHNVKNNLILISLSISTSIYKFLLYIPVSKKKDKGQYLVPYQFFRYLFRDANWTISIILQP